MSLRTLGRILADIPPEKTREETSRTWDMIANICLRNGVVTFDSQEGVNDNGVFEIADDQKAFQTIYDRIQEPFDLELQNGGKGPSEKEYEILRQQAIDEYRHNGGTTQMRRINTMQRAYIVGYVNLDVGRAMCPELNRRGVICMLGELVKPGLELESNITRLPLTFENYRPVTMSAKQDYTPAVMVDDLTFSYSEQKTQVEQELKKLDPFQLACVQIIDPQFGRPMAQFLLPEIARVFRFCV